MATSNRKAKTSPKKKAEPKTARSTKSKTKRTKIGSASAADRRKLFIEAYLSNGQNITQAALAAGFAPKSAASQGSRLLKDAKIRQELDSRRGALMEKAQLTTESVLESLRQALFFDPRKLYREDGSLKLVTELDDDTAMALASFEVFEEYGPTGTSTELEPQPHGGGLKRQHRGVIGHTAKIKWLDKTATREQAAKMLGMFERDNRQKTDPLAELIAQLGRSSLPIVE